MMAGQNTQLRVLWATAANFATEVPCCRGTCAALESPSLKIRKVVEPDYPEAAQKNRIRGTVIIEALIDADGVPGQVRILRGDPALAASTADAVSQWRWEPPDTEVIITIAVNFEPE